MSKTLSAERFRVNLATWTQQVAQPSISPGIPSGRGGLLSRSNPSSAVAMTQLWENTGGTPTSWTIQNRDLRVFNIVRDYGAVGDGVTSCNAAIDAAVAAADAAGGGIVYIPPAPLGYAVYKNTVGIANRAGILVRSRTNIVFMGDGPASRIKLTGSAGGGDYYGFYVRNASRRITFTNFAIDASTVTNPDPGDQLHLIQLRGLTSDGDTSAPTDVDIIGMWFGQTVGDCVRTVGESTRIVKRTRVAYCSFNPTSARAPVSIQRYWEDVTISYNWLTGSSDQLIDFEPTGGAQDRQFKVVGNHLLASAGGLPRTITLGGGTIQPLRFSTVAYNLMTDGTGCLATAVRQTVFVGNIFTIDVGAVGTAGLRPMDMNRGIVDVIVHANVFDAITCADTTQALQINSVPAIASPSNCVVSDNILATNLSDAALSMLGCPGSLVRGNMALARNNTTGTGSGGCYATQAGANVGRRAALIGNWGKIEAAAARSIFLVTSPDATDQFSTMVSGNYGRAVSVTTGVRLQQKPGQVFAKSRTANHNMAIGITGSVVEAPANGVGIEGCNADLNPSIMTALATPVSSISAAIGSLFTNPAGAQASVLFTKGADTGASTGWQSVGGTEVSFGVLDLGPGTTAVFLGTGMTLAVPDTTEIEIVIPRDGVIRNLRVKQTVGVGAGTATFTLRKNGASTGLTAAPTFISTGAVSGGTLVTVVPGDRISIQVTKSQAPGTAPTFVTASLEISG